MKSRKPRTRSKSNDRRSARRPAADPQSGDARGEKIHKLLAATGRYSRRGAEELVAAGRVHVKGRRVQVGERFSGTERITVDRSPVRLSPPDSSVLPRLLMYHKPEGEICSRNDPERRRSVFDGLPRLQRGRWIVVGRLDVSSTGLLLFCNDGSLANRLMHPSSGIDREYLVRVRGRVDQAVLDRLLEGVMLEDGWASFSDIHAGGEGATNRWFTVVVQRGHNREVRRLWESQGLQVSRLKRVRFANLFLPSGLRPGRYREFGVRDIRLLLDYCDQLEAAAQND